MNVYLYDIDDLGAVVSASRGERAREAEKAEAIVAAELDSFFRWAIKDIRVSIEHLREAELGRLAAGWPA